MRKPQLWALIVPSFVVFWALGFGFMWWFIVPPIMLFLSRRIKQKAHLGALLLAGLGAWLTLSIGVSIAAETVEVGRIPGAAYTAFFWIAAASMLWALNKASPEQSAHFTFGLIFLGALQGLVSIIAVLFHPSPLSAVKFMSALVFRGSSGVEPWTVAHLAYQNFFGTTEIVRSSGMMGTAAWSGGYACLVLIVLILRRRPLLTSGFTPLAWVASVVLTGISLYLSYSRASWGILAAVLVVYSGCRFFSRIRGKQLLLALGAVSVVGIVILMFVPWQKVLLAQDALRPGSSQTRIALYSAGIDAVATEGPLAVIGGLGVKPLVDSIGKGAGSESTVLSLFVRGGLIALVIFLAFILALLIRSIRARDFTGVALVVATAIHSVVEDLDIGSLTLLLVLVEFVPRLGEPQSPPHSRAVNLGATGLGSIGETGADPSKL